MCNCKQHEYELLPELEASFNGRSQAMNFETKPKAANGNGNGGAKRMVDPKKVDCANLDRSYPIFKAIGTTDPVNALEKIVQRAVEMLDNTIGELKRIREEVKAGASLGWPLISDTFGLSLAKRMRLNINDRNAWITGAGPGTVGLVIRWLSNIRKIIAGGYIWYTCLASECSEGDWAFVWNSQNAENRRLKRNFFRIHLCRLFWKPGTDPKDPMPPAERAKNQFEFQAQTIIHEASHIYYNTSDDPGRGAGVAECVAQFVAETNNSPIDPNFIKRCGGKL
jgi:hypothetical protein